MTQTVEFRNRAQRRPRAPAYEREATALARRAAVERAVETLRRRFREPLTLDDLASESFFSKYHFNRVFRVVTGVPPGRFLAALRMEAAKQLLTTTDLRVTDICLDVGYRSLGTFTTHFRELVGIAPSRMRRLADAYGDVPVGALVPPELAAGAPPLTVRVRAADEFAGTAFVGLFPTPLPQMYPAGCSIAAVPDDVPVDCGATGPVYALANAFADRLTIGDALLGEADATRVAVSRAPVVVDTTPTRVELELRRLGPLDPPVVLALPLVLAAASARVAPRPSRAAA